MRVVAYAKNTHIMKIWKGILPFSWAACRQSRFAFRPSTTEITQVNSEVCFDPKSKSHENSLVRQNP